MKDNEHTCNKSSFLIFKWGNLFDIHSNGQVPLNLRNSLTDNMCLKTALYFSGRNLSEPYKTLSIQEQCDERMIQYWKEKIT